MPDKPGKPRVYLGPDRQPLLRPDGTPMPKDEVLRVWKLYYDDLEHTRTLSDPHTEEVGRPAYRRKEAR